MDKMQIVAAAADNGWNRHGYPQGYHFVPDDLELIRLLEDRLAGRSLPFPLANIFQHVKIRDFHPAEFYEAYKGHQECGYIYFFNEREFPSQSSKVRPMRAIKGGNYWKASGGGKELRRGGSAVGYKLTMVFYVKKPPGQKDVKTLWAVHEFTRIVGPSKKVADMALYRLYLMPNSENKEKKAAAARSNKSNATTSAKGEEVVAPAPPSPPQHPYFAGPSTSQAHAYHQQAFGAPAEPSTSGWVRPAAGRMEIAGPPAATGYQQQQQHMTVQYTTDLADWDKRLPALGSPGQAAVAARDLPASQHFGYQQTNGQHLVYHETNRQQMQTFPPPASQHFGYREAAGSLKNLPPSPTPLPAPGAEGGYLTNEFDVWCETQQQQEEKEDPQQVAAGASLSPTPDNIGINDVLTDLMAETSDMSCTFEELIGIGIMEWPSPPSPPPAMWTANDQVDSSSINQQEQSVHSSQFTRTNDQV